MNPTSITIPMNLPETDVCYIDCLPNEMLDAILSYVGNYAVHASMVCKLWRQLLPSPKCNLPLLYDNMPLMDIFAEAFRGRPDLTSVLLRSSIDNHAYNIIDWMAAHELLCYEHGVDGNEQCNDIGCTIEYVCLYATKIGDLDALKKLHMCTYHLTPSMITLEHSITLTSTAIISSEYTTMLWLYDIGHHFDDTALKLAAQRDNVTLFTWCYNVLRAYSVEQIVDCIMMYYYSPAIIQAIMRRAESAQDYHILSEALRSAMGIPCTEFVFQQDIQMRQDEV